mmetsp:Transcript_2447/g.3940  ORF Transcript_2447/g.3940 Transcript_2447/m.3940 type:complete len:118 (-) Transcript_2447:526-879(-)
MALFKAPAGHLKREININTLLHYNYHIIRYKISFLFQMDVYPVSPGCCAFTTLRCRKEEMPMSSGMRRSKIQTQPKFHFMPPGMSGMLSSVDRNMIPLQALMATTAKAVPSMENMLV